MSHTVVQQQTEMICTAVGGFGPESGAAVGRNYKGEESRCPQRSRPGAAVGTPRAVYRRRQVPIEVLIETWRLIRHRLSDFAAEQFWNGLRGGIATIVQTTDADLEAAWAISDRFPDQSFSIVGRTSFSLMERLGIPRVIAFDQDFEIYRYGRRQALAFEVLR